MSLNRAVRHAVQVMQNSDAISAAAAATVAGVPEASTSADPTASTSSSGSVYDQARPARGLKRPSLVHLASHGLPNDRPALNSYESWLRTLPDSALSSASARYADFSRPSGVAPSIESHRVKRRPSEASLHHWRARSASVSSLNSVLSANSRFSATRAQSRKGKEPDEDLEPVSETDASEATSKPAQGSSSSSWKSWFNFGSGDAVDPQAKSDAHESERGFLSLFAGTGAVEEAREHTAHAKVSDEAESDLLSAPLPVLSDVASYISRITSGPASNEQSKPSDAASDHVEPASSNAKKTSSSFLSTSIFSSTSANPLQSPASMLSSLSLNPFSGSPSTYKTPSRGYSQDHHPKRDVNEYLDEQDTAASKAEDDSHMDRYTLIKERYKCPQYPLVFCHGLFGFDTLGPSVARIHYWIGVKEALESIGVEVLITRVPTSASIEERAKVLCETIEKEYPGREVNLIGHSMGGLDGRFLITHLQPTTFKVRSLTTITTPHQGSSFADYMLEEVIGNNNMPALLRLVESLGIPGGGRAFDNLTTTKMARFNADTPDHPDVKYFSYGAEFKPSWSNVFRLSWKVIYEREGDNDGLVSVESARHGNYLGTLSDVNHIDVIGMVGPVRYNWAALMGRPIKFKPVSFFLAMAEMLAENEL